MIVSPVHSLNRIFCFGIVPDETFLCAGRHRPDFTDIDTG